MADYAAATYKPPRRFRGRHRRLGLGARLAGRGVSIRQAYLAVMIVAVGAPVAALLFGTRTPEPRQLPATVQADSDRAQRPSRAIDREEWFFGGAEPEIPLPSAAAPSRPAQAPKTLRAAPKAPPQVVRRWIIPAPGPLVSSFRTSSRPGHAGVDLGAVRGTAIRAVSGGTVERVRCNAVDVTTGRDWGCDRDGDFTRVRGCGWYVDVAHAGGIVTRYCHMLRQPSVRVGQTLKAGQILGYVGSSGHSTGPHLHFEVHKGSPATSENAIDPIRFMASRGARLGRPS